MLIGVPKEIKTHEYRVGLVPSSVRELVHNGHKVISRPAPVAASASTIKPQPAGAMIAANREVFGPR
jgi:alanine dehydrogenase